MSVQGWLWASYLIFEDTLDHDPELAFEQELHFIQSIRTKQNQDFHKVCLLPVSHELRVFLTSGKSAQFRIIAMTHHFECWQRHEDKFHKMKSESHQQDLEFHQDKIKSHWRRFEFHRGLLRWRSKGTIEKVPLSEADEILLEVSESLVFWLRGNDSHHVLSLSL